LRFPEVLLVTNLLDQGFDKFGNIRTLMKSCQRGD